MQRNSVKPRVVRVFGAVLLFIPAIFFSILVNLYVFTISVNIWREYFHMNGVFGLSSLVNFVGMNDRVPDSISTLNSTSLKIYVYDLPPGFNTDFVRTNPRCLKTMVSSEIYIHWSVLSSSVITMNPLEADWFYIPFYSTSKLDSQNFPISIEYLARVTVQFVVLNYPFWNRSEGGDHFVVVPHDFGPCFQFIDELATSSGIPSYFQKVTFLQTFGHRNHTCMRPGSIVIPPFVSPHHFHSSLHEGALSHGTKRDIFIYFRGKPKWELPYSHEGTYSRNVRQTIFNFFEGHPSFNLGNFSETYYQDMRRSVFCLCPLGWSPWSPRIVESLVTGCIPVIISDNIIFPFETQIPWRSFSVFIPEAEVIKLDEILNRFSKQEIRRMQLKLNKPEYRLAMTYLVPSVPGDAFHHILNELASINRSRTMS